MHIVLIQTQSHKKTVLHSTLLILSAVWFLATPTAYGEPASKEQQAILLESSFLQFIDGQPFGIDAEVFSSLVLLRLKFKHLFYGDPTSEKVFALRGKKYTLKEMALIEIKEEKIFRDYSARKTTFSALEWQEIEKEHTTQLAALHDGLIAATTYVADYLLPFLRDIQPMKKQLAPLVSMSCEKRGRTESLLPACISAADGKELIYFQSNMTSYKQLGLFCLDLVHVLTDIIYSCPKARAQFEQLRKTDTTTQSIIDSTAE